MGDSHKHSKTKMSAYFCQHRNSQLHAGETLLTGLSVVTSLTILLMTGGHSMTSEVKSFQLNLTEREHGCVKHFFKDQKQSFGRT